MTTTGRRVCVLGAGIVGCATAYALARAGWEVSLVDAHGRAGEGASKANGGQLSYSYVEPLATPSALRALPGWLVLSDSPLRWRPRAEIAHLRWLAAFIAACRWPRVRATTDALLGLSFLGRRVLHGWLDENPGLADQARHARPGKLVIFRKAEARASAERQIGWQRHHGCDQRIVEPDECIALEPALGATGGGAIAFGVWTGDEEVADAARLAEGLARASGATLLLGRRALGFELRAGRVAALRCDDGPIEADHFVLAGGPAAPELLRPLGMRLPIEAIRGYSVTLPIVDAGAAPRVSITDNGRKLVHARLGDRLRVAGFAELCGPHPAIDPRRIEALLRAVEQTFPGACDFSHPQPWAGLRPATPGGRPMLGRSRVSNLWINAGHGALGLTLAPGSAAQLAALMSGEAPPLAASLFRVPS
ncbi:FAD-dependent oxidoreductase [Xylophilus sp. GOD-11R]|uniref:FAD-dependent oxidoreductase n=1 Tax=Xylophilus sp. GOD-11R TaxID=3089814 RepID=UPI00298D5F6E|nr:FAD-dependent oxidoreductase [Xylophilus sp. GOD-11R]WPB57195.1 FAD-dependent oxidoreductase [Xylophilus sp. GOD-11R]